MPPNQPGSYFLRKAETRSYYPNPSRFILVADQCPHRLQAGTTHLHELLTVAHPTRSLISIDSKRIVRKHLSVAGLSDAQAAQRMQSRNAYQSNSRTTHHLCRRLSVT
jgi:hypothetical protein